MPGEKAQLAIREAMKAALKVVSMKDLMNLCEAHTGIKFATKQSNLSKFAANGGNINESDLANFRSLLLTTETGNLLLGKKVAATPPIAALLEAMRSGKSRGAESQHLGGAFLAYHGSYMFPDHYVVRALEFQHLGDGMITVLDHLRDDKSPVSSDLKATGAVSFPNDKPHILLLRHDNAIGFNLIIGDDFVVREKSVLLIGQTSGVNRMNAHFSRPILMRKQREPLAALLPKTGIYPFSELDDNARAEFNHLVRASAMSVFPDPILRFSKASLQRQKPNV